MSTFKSLDEYDFSEYQASPTGLYVLCLDTEPPLLILPEDGRPVGFSEIVSLKEGCKFGPQILMQVAGPHHERGPATSRISA